VHPSAEDLAWNIYLKRTKINFVRRDGELGYIFSTGITVVLAQMIFAEAYFLGLRSYLSDPENANRVTTILLVAGLSSFVASALLVTLLERCVENGYFLREQESMDVPAKRNNGP